MLAAHALVASFLGGATIRVAGLDVLGSIALATLVIGLVVSAILLAPWHLKFAVNARDLYDELDEQAAEEAEADTLGWLAAAGSATRHFARRTRRRSVACPGSRACSACSS